MSIDSRAGRRSVAGGCSPSRRSASSLPGGARPAAQDDFVVAVANDRVQEVKRLLARGRRSGHAWTATATRCS